MTPDKFVCSAKCWEPVTCPDHGHEMTPCGRDAPMSMYQCCENYMTRINTRHLWDEHDSTRYYTDPAGWTDHEANCAKCRGEDDE